MNLLATRLLSASSLFLLTLLVGTVPVYFYQKWLRKKREQTRDPKSSHRSLSANFYVQAVTQIGGGILFFTVLVHMIPEVRNNFEKYLKSNHSVFADGSSGAQVRSIEDLSLPYLEIAICIGFFVVYFAEVLMHSLLDEKHGTHSRRPTVLTDKTVSNGVNNNINESVSTVANGSQRDDDQEYDETSAIIDRPNRTHSHNEEPVVIVVDHPYDNDGQESTADGDRMLVRLLHGLVIISSFSIHSLFDGISIGVRAESSEVWTMFIAITSHKLMIALIVSVELYEKCRHFGLLVFNMVLFAVMSPIGIAVVIVFERSVDTHSETNPVVILLSAIASGTIIYIVFFEILQKHRVDRLPPIIQFVCMFIGFGIMFMVTITLTEE